jgi:acyl-CoA synthetase (AMP-forming)/AMP-acid ligase II
MTNDQTTDTVPLLLSLLARTRGSALAIIDPGRRSLSYSALHQEVERLGVLLGELGFGQGGRIAVALPSGPEAAVAMLATMSWAVCAPLDPSLELEACASLLESMRADALLALQGEEVPAVSAARTLGLRVLRLLHPSDEASEIIAVCAESIGRPVEPKPPRGNDLALILHTSGTTAQPKIVPLNHAQIIARARLNPLVASDRGIYPAPLFTSSAIESGLLATVAAGASVVFPARFDAEGIVDHLERLQPTYMWASPGVYAEVLEAVVNRKSAVTTSLRFLRSGGSALPAVLQENLEAAFDVPVMQGYGMTETGVIARNPLPPGQRRAGSAGKPLGTQVHISSSTGKFLPQGEVGEIVVQGAGVMTGYENAEANRLAFRDGWFRTGDLGYFDEDGFLFLTGRLDEAINRGGRQVSPAEVDTALLSHPAVFEAATFAVPHPSLTADVAAAVVLRAPGAATAQELRQYALARLAPFKVPTTIVLVDSLPKNALGKVQRSVLAGTLRESLRASFLPPRDKDEEFVARVFAQVLGLERIGALDNFFELGGDSLSGMRVVARVNLACGIDLSAVSLFEMPTVGEFANAVRNMKRTGALTEAPMLKRRHRDGGAPDGGHRPVTEGSRTPPDAKET